VSNHITPKQVDVAETFRYNITQNPTTRIYAYARDDSETRQYNVYRSYSKNVQTRQDGAADIPELKYILWCPFFFSFYKDNGNRKIHIDSSRKRINTSSQTFVSQDTHKQRLNRFVIYVCAPSCTYILYCYSAIILSYFLLIFPFCV